MATPATRTPRPRYASDAPRRRAPEAPVQVPEGRARYGSASGSVPGTADHHPSAPRRRSPGAGERRSRLETRRVARARAQRRRRAIVLALMLAAAGLLGVDMVRRISAEPAGTAQIRARAEPTAAGTAAASAAAPSASGAASSATAGASARAYPENGPGTWAYAGGQGSVLGSAGKLHAFRVAVEERVGQRAGDFAKRVDTVLGDQRGWTASGDLRLRRVPKGTTAEFTIYLATPGTTEKMCALGGMHTAGYTSCRLPGQVIINVARYLDGVPAYGAPLAEYQAYLINHEVGHQLGYGHQACPAPGRLAPVMQQQTLGLQGCVPNAWPYVDGKRYSGPAVP